MHTTTTGQIVSVG